VERENTTIDLEVDGKIYSIIFTPVAEMGYLNLYGRDVTERRRAEVELVIANKELAFQNEEKEKRAAELVVANKELVFQNEEKEKRAAELVVANKELVFQNEEKEKKSRRISRCQQRTCLSK